MAAITNWDAPEERFFEVGVDHGILYQYNNETGQYDRAKKWPGLISVSESNEGGAEVAFYADGNKYFTTREYGSFRATIEAYQYPDGVTGFDGLDMYPYSGGIWIDGQPNSGGDSLNKFGMYYRTILGNGIEMPYAYRYHLVYNASFSRPERKYKTYGDNPEAMVYTWDLATGNVDFKRHLELYPTSHIIFDSRHVTGWSMLDRLLRGASDEMLGTPSEPVLPSPDLALELLKQDRSHIDELSAYLT